MLEKEEDHQLEIVEDKEDHMLSSTYLSNSLKVT